jgi:hypothetical protein
MKKFIILTIMLIVANIGIAQWKIETYDNGFDKPTYFSHASVKSETSYPMINTKDEFTEFHIDAELILFGDNPILIIDYFIHDINYSKCKGTITFKVNGVNKKYDITGIKIGYNRIVISLDSMADNISKLLQGRFLNDFKNASKMKVDIDNDIDVFNMKGSANAYNKVKSLKKYNNSVLSDIYELNKLMVNSGNIVDITYTDYYKERLKQEKIYEEERERERIRNEERLRMYRKQFNQLHYNDIINIGDTVIHKIHGYKIVVTGEEKSYNPYHNEYILIGKLLTDENDNNADNIVFKLYNISEYKKIKK